MKTFIIAALLILCTGTQTAELSREKVLASAGKILAPLIPSINYFATHEQPGGPTLLASYQSSRERFKKAKLTPAEIAESILAVAKLPYTKGEYIRMEKAIRAAKLKPFTNDDTTFLEIPDELGDIIKAMKEKTFPEN